MVLRRGIQKSLYQSRKVLFSLSFQILNQKRNEIIRNPSDSCSYTGNIVSLDLEFYSTEGHHTGNLVNSYYVDHFSDEHWCGGSKGKTGGELCDVLEGYIQHMKRLTGNPEYKIFLLQMDNPKEFLMGKFADRVRQLGIHVRASVPYVKEQNGKQDNNNTSPNLKTQRQTIKTQKNKQIKTAKTQNSKQNEK